MLSDCLLAGPVPRQFSGSSPALESSQSVSQPFNRCPESSQSASQPIKTALNLASQPVSHSKIALNLVVSQSASQPVSHSASQPVNQSPHRSPLVARTQRSNCLFRAGPVPRQFPGSSLTLESSQSASQPIKKCPESSQSASQPNKKGLESRQSASQPIKRCRESSQSASWPIKKAL